MKTKLTLLILLVSFIQIHAQNLQFPKDFEDPKALGEGKEYPRSEFVTKQMSTSKISLNGDWKIFYVKNPSDRPSGFEKLNYDDSSWESVHVPGNFEIQGFDIPIYVNTEFEFADTRRVITEMKEPNPPHVPHDYNPVFSLRKNFKLDESDLEKELFLHFSAIKGAFYLWVNGDYVGYSKGSKTPAEFNVNQFVKAGENTIAVQLYRWSDANYLEAQDFWRLSGFDREVYIFAQPKQRIKDYHLTANLINNYKDGDFKLDVDLANSLDKNKKIILEYQLFSDSNELLYSEEKKVKIQKNSDLKVNFQSTLKGVKSWNAENPNLYKLVLRTKDSKGNLRRIKKGFWI